MAGHGDERTLHRDHRVTVWEKEKPAMRSELYEFRRNKRKVRKTIYVSISDFIFIDLDTERIQIAEIV